MNNKTLVSAVLFLIVLVGGIFILSDKKTGEDTSQTSNGIVLFYGDGCPHCANVEAFLEENNVKNKVVFENKEVYYNKTNAEEMRTKAGACGLATDSIGVPFLSNGTECLIGDQDIINFFKAKINVQ
jgi:glutaredoxin